MIESEKVTRARVAREVGTALSLYLSGRFRPRLMLYGGLVRMALPRIGTNEDGLAAVFADAVLFGQACEAQFLGKAPIDLAAFPPGAKIALARAVIGADLWRPVVQTLTTSLQIYGLITTTQIAVTTESGNTGSKTTGERLSRKILNTEKEFQL